MIWGNCFWRTVRHERFTRLQRFRKAAWYSFSAGPAAFAQEGEVDMICVASRILLPDVQRHRFANDVFCSKKPEAEILRKTPHMFVHKISLRNIRGFESLEFDLARPDGSYAGWTVFTGDNGSGKSTLLKAIAVCLTGKDTARALQPSFHRWIRHGSTGQQSSIELQILRNDEDDKLTNQGKAPKKIPLAKLATDA